MHPYSVLEKPLLTEKSNLLREEGNQYSFQVRLDASKEDVSKAVNMLFGVRPVKVQTSIQRGKVKRRKTSFTKPTKTKRAIVTLKEGDKIGIFEDA